MNSIDMKNTLKLLRRAAEAVLGMVLAAFTMVSCVSDEVEINPAPKGGDSRETVFRISVSGGTPHQTRAIAENGTADNAIHDLLFLLFGSDGKLLTGADGYGIVSSNLALDQGKFNQYTVKVAIHKDAKQAIVVANWGRLQTDPVAAANSLVASLADKTAAQVAASDLLNFDAFPGGNKDFTADHPYHLMGSQPFAIPATATIALTRSLAKINVAVVGNSGVMNGFKLKTIRLVHVNRNARMLPSTTAGTQNIPAAPGSVGSTGVTYTYTVNNASGQARSNTFVDEIFLPETDVATTADDFTGSTWKTAPTLLIQATLNPGGDRWFRVNLRMADTKDGNKLKHVDILRNHKYMVNITGIGGMGYATAQEAYDALPGDLIVDMTATNLDPDLTNTVYNGQYYLSTNGPTFEFAGQEHDDGPLKIYTDYPGGWKIESISASWLTVISAPITPEITTGGTPSVKTFHLTKNATGAPRTATITISAGPLTSTLTISQEVAAATYLNVDPKNVSYLHNEGVAKTIIVTADGPWTATITSGDDSNFTLTENSGSGNGTFTVKPKNSNISTTDPRTVTITVTATGADPLAVPPVDVTAVQWPNTPEGVRNIEGTVNGIIGYIYHPGYDDHHKLTLAKDDKDDTNGIVYVAFFKFGSLVAISSQKTGIFTSSDIIAWPDQWIDNKGNNKERTALNAHFLGTAAGQDSWNKVLKMTLSAGHEVKDYVNLSNGQGDPCDYWFGDGDGDADTPSTWRLPTAVENTRWVGGPDTGTGSVWKTWANGDTNYYYLDAQITGTSSYGKYDYWDNNRGTLSVSNPGIGSFPVVTQTSPARTAFSEKLPAAGGRLEDGSVNGLGSNGSYWSSTAASGTIGYNLLFFSSRVSPVNISDNAAGYAVRCVRP